MSQKAVLQTNNDVTKRLRRAEGHLRKIITMIQEGRPCLDIAQQLQAVESAVKAAKKALIHDHLDHCLDAALDPGAEDGRTVVAAFKEIAKYL